MGRANIFWSMVILATPPLASSHLLPLDFYDDSEELPEVEMKVLPLINTNHLLNTKRNNIKTKLLR